MGISKQIQLEEISADSFIRERADRLRNEYERKLQECIEDMLRLKQTWIVKWRSIMALALSTTLKTALSIRALPTRTPKARSCLARRTLPAANICFTRKICQLPLQRRRKGDGRTGRTGNY
jgi:hypothetical protein